jgi:hypothetical protein
MSRRVVVLLVVLGIAVPYCALGAALWFSRSTPQPARAMVVVKLVAVPIYSCVQHHRHGRWFHSIGGKRIELGRCPSMSGRIRTIG